MVVEIRLSFENLIVMLRRLGVAMGRLSLAATRLPAKLASDVQLPILVLQLHPCRPVNGRETRIYVNIFLKTNGTLTVAFTLQNFLSHSPSTLKIVSHHRCQRSLSRQRSCRSKVEYRCLRRSKFTLQCLAHDT